MSARGRHPASCCVTAARTKLVKAWGPVLLAAVLTPSLAVAAKGPSSAEIKKHASQTIKKESERDCAAACARAGCASYDFDATKQRCELRATEPEAGDQSVSRMGSRAGSQSR